MKAYQDLLAEYERWGRTKEEQEATLEKIIRKVDNQMDLKFTSLYILNQMTVAGFATVVALDIIKAVELDRAKRTDLGKLLYV